MEQFYYSIITSTISSSGTGFSSSGSSNSSSGSSNSNSREDIRFFLQNSNLIFFIFQQLLMTGDLMNNI